jgi:hypothetical protein
MQPGWRNTSLEECLLPENSKCTLCLGQGYTQENRSKSEIVRHCRQLPYTKERGEGSAGKQIYGISGIQFEKIH